LTKFDVVNGVARWFIFKPKILFGAQSENLRFLFRWHRPGLPDGLFLNQKSQFGQILEGLGNGKCWFISDHLDYFMAIR
jgi:hypothetical protein